jgi:cytochrome c oxidase subunit 3/cytochrome o ubiquinol oxidase subunit 3
MSEEGRAVNETNPPPTLPTGPGLSPGSAAAVALQVPPPVHPEHNLSAAQWGMLSFLASEVAFFSTLIVAYIVFMGQDTDGPTPKVLSLWLVLGTTACLLSSSGTVHLAERALRQGNQSAFCLWWAATIGLGVLFLAGTGKEWFDLITRYGLTISRNLFGTTFYTLVGFHSLHVTGGVITMLIILGLALRRQVTTRNEVAVQLVSWYWHFVDGVWIVVFTVVYLIGR